MDNAPSSLSAIVTLYPDAGKRPRAWQTQPLRFPTVLLERRRTGGWSLELNHRVCMQGPTREALLRDLRELHGIEALLAAEPVAPEPAPVTLRVR